MHSQGTRKVIGAKINNKMKNTKGLSDFYRFADISNTMVNPQRFYRR